jgi:ABC-type multidrug transport system fused ATPase/permease subunit
MGQTQDGDDQNMGGELEGARSGGESFMPGTQDDLRAAATIATSLSSYVITGALAIIGAEAALFVFVLDKKSMPALFYLLFAASFLVLVASCYLGGKGIWKIYEDGAKGTWTIRAGGTFAFQLILALLGIFLLVAGCIWATADKDKEPAKAVNAGIEEKLSAIQQSLTSLSEIHALNVRLEAIEAEMRKAPASKTRNQKANTPGH